MKRQIRRCIFETNSSMSNTLLLMSEKEYEEFEERFDDDNYVWDYENNKFIHLEDREEDGEYSFGNPFEDKEESVRTYTTEHGDVVVGVSFVGWD